MALDTEAAIIANFDFLSREGDDLDDDDDEEEVNDVIRNTPSSFRHSKFKVNILTENFVKYHVACIVS